MKSEVSDPAGEAFIRQLQMLIDVVGNPSAGRLAAESRRRNKETHPMGGGTPLAKTTVEDYLKWKRRRLPAWRLVREILMTCRFIAGKDKLPFDEDVLGTESEWYTLWSASRHGQITRNTPIRLAELGMEVIYVPPQAMRFTRLSDGSRYSHHQPANTERDTALTPELTSNAGEAQAGLAAEHEATGATVYPGDMELAGSKSPVASGPLRMVLAPELAEGGGWVTMIRWHVKSGADVMEGAALANVVNEMALDFALTVPYAGIVREILVSEGTQVPAGQGLCVIQSY